MMPGLVALVRPDGDVAAASPLWNARLGAALDGLRNTPGPLLDALRAGQHEGTATALLDAKPRPVRWSSQVLHEHEQVTGWLVLLDVPSEPEAQNLSDLYRAHARLEETQRMLLDAQRMAGLGSWQWSAGSGRIEWSDVVYHIFDLPVGGEVSLETYLSRVHPEDREALQQAIEQALTEQRGYTIQHRVVWPDGRMRYVHSVAEVTHDDDGAIVLTGTVQDLTERVEAEQALADTLQALEQRNRELQDFAYVASHDLQEPLRKIRAFGGLLLKDNAAQLDASGQHYLERIDDAATRMSRLISDLLTFSRVATRAHPFQKVHLSDIAREVLDDLEIALEESKGTVEVGNLPTLEADPMQMRQLFQNLIGNALKFREPGRLPRVQVRAKVRTASAGKVVVLEVADNGIGFEEKYLDRIFTPFQRLHHHAEYPGTGMGLAICRRIVERHGGQITARSTPGEGTTFVITLPCVPPPSPAALHHHDA